MPTKCCRSHAGDAPAVIDLHTHLHPPRLARAIRRWFAERSTWVLDAQPSEPAAVAAVLREHGVERFVFCSYAHKTGMARDLNAWLVETSRELGGYGIPLATIHPGDPDYVGDLRAALDAGCAGLKLHEDVQQLAADDERLDPAYAELAARGAFLLVHVGPIPWAFPRHAGPARIARVLGRHPALQVVVAHFGVPDSAEYCALMAAHPGLHLDTTMVFGDPSPLAVGVEPALIEAHADRVVFGSDFPNVPYPYGTERAALERLGLRPQTLAAVLGGNAARLLGTREGVA